MSHSHHPENCSHNHTHGHHHTPSRFGKAFAIGISLNIAFVLAETATGFISNSMALLADAGHNASDVLSLAVAWLGLKLATRKPTATHSYGLRGSSMLAALFNAVLLLVTVGALGWEAMGRLIHPQPIEPTLTMATAAIGIVINGVTAWLFAGEKHDTNIRGAFLHMAADAALSGAVVLGAGLIALTGWESIDPALSLLICAVIVASTWGLLKDTLGVAMAATPPHINPEAVKTFLSNQKGIKGVHHLHIWPLGTSEIALTCHLTMPEGATDKTLHHLAEELEHHFGIHHSTFQVEKSAKNCPCPLEEPHPHP